MKKHTAQRITDEDIRNAVRKLQQLSRQRELTHKEVCSRGGKNSWKGKSKKERYEIIKARWAKGRENKAK